jgi:3-phosphoshikimate 1-carboxyvinyltransferase
MIEIVPKAIKECSVAVPGSKSCTHRIVIASALSDGTCVVTNALDSEDTRHTVQALRQMGVPIDKTADRLEIRGAGGTLSPCDEPIYLGNSGTSMRLLTAVAALGKGTYILTGASRMKERPIQDLIDGLTGLGVPAKSLGSKGCPPVEIRGCRPEGGSIGLACRISSQFLSAILMISPFCKKGAEITVTEGPVSKPYIDLTLDVMQTFGIISERNGYEWFRVPGGQTYKPGNYTVEPDCSQAGYFWGAAAITGARVTVLGISRSSKQGDVRFADLLGEMGCRIREEHNGITVQGTGELNGIVADMGDMPDMVPTLAVVSAFARGETRIVNVPHLKAKESDRLGSVVNELNKMGVESECTETGLTVIGGNPHGAEIETYKDHRIAMSFAMAGLKIPGIRIFDERVVEKSFPTFWEVFSKLQ